VTQVLDSSQKFEIPRERQGVAIAGERNGAGESPS
jgi:hypothetical protein